jgi:hypothetical protein
MKTFMMTLAAIATLLVTPAIADNFNNTTADLTLVSGALDVEVGANNDGLADIQVGVTVSDFHIAVGTDIVESDNLYVRGEYTRSATLIDSVDVYGTAAIKYASTVDFSSGVWSIDPTVGVSHEIADMVSVYGEVGYTWDASNDFNGLGGVVEVGTPFTLTSGTTVTPSVTYSTESKNVDLNVNATYRF